MNTKISTHVPKHIRQLIFNPWLYGTPYLPTLPKKTRKTRSDKGTWHITERDRRLLQWIGEQYVIRFDHLQQLLGQTPQGADKTIRTLTADASRRVISNWKRKGFVTHRKVFQEQPGYVWLTRSGLRAIGLKVRYATPSPALLDHYHAINTIRLSLEIREPEGVWESERLIRSRLQQGKKGQKQPHTPDAWFFLPNSERVVGVEVELHPKKKNQLYEIHGSFGGMLMLADEIWYFGTRAARIALLNAVKETAMNSSRGKFRFDLYPPDISCGLSYPPPFL
jgi:hypothetical protein